MSIIEKAEALAEAISECPEMKAVHEKEAALHSNEEAEVILSTFMHIQKALYENQQEGEKDTPELVEKFNEVQQQMQGSEIIMDYFKAQEQLSLVLQKVNMIIGKAFTPEGEGSCDESSCASCGGGCN